MWRTQVDNSTRKGLFKSSYISNIVLSIIFAFIGWMIGLMGDNVRYSDYEKNRLHALGNRLGVGTAIGFFWGVILGIGLFVNGIRNSNVFYIIISILAIPLSIWLGVACVRKYKNTLNNIIEKNQLYIYNTYDEESNKTLTKEDNNDITIINTKKDNEDLKEKEKIQPKKQTNSLTKTKHIIVAHKKSKDE